MNKRVCQFNVLLLFVLICVVLVLPSCGDLSKKVANITGYSRQCVDGVEYLQFPSGVTVAYTPDGKIKTCK